MCAVQEKWKRSFLRSSFDSIGNGHAICLYGACGNLRVASDGDLLYIIIMIAIGYY